MKIDSSNCELFILFMCGCNDFPFYTRIDSIIHNIEDNLFIAFSPKYKAVASIDKVWHIAAVAAISYQRTNRNTHFSQCQYSSSFHKPLHNLFSFVFLIYCVIIIYENKKTKLFVCCVALHYFWVRLLMDVRT